MTRRVALLVVAALVLVSSSCGLPIDHAQRVPTFPIYDPSTGEIPMPNDAVRDDDEGHLDLPIDDDATDAERDFREYLNTRDGWSTTLPASVRFSDAIDADTVDAESVQLWEWLPTPRRVEDVTIRIDEDDHRLQLVPPRTGWTNGHTYVVLVRGGRGGVRDVHGFPIEPDAIFYFLRRDERLDTIGHNRAFPGPTRRERLDAGMRLEELRREIAPYFEFFEDPARDASSEVSRNDVAALWSFTVTEQPELAMDRDSQRVPLPFDLLLDRETGHVALEPADWDTPLERDAKLQANELDGFAVSANLMFELTQPVDGPSTEGRIHLFEVTDTSTRELPTTTRVMGEHGEQPCRSSPVPLDCVHLVVQVADEELPLRGASTYVIVVDEGLRAANGMEVAPMPIGHFMRTPYPIEVDGHTQVSSLTDELAQRLEWTRRRVSRFLDGYGRDRIITAWPFTTLDAPPTIRETARTATRMELEPEITVLWRKPPGEALQELFPGALDAIVRGLYLTRTNGVAEFVEGTIPSPYFLDRTTRRWREDGEHEMQPVHFYMSIPEDVDTSRPLPVVIFGHAIVTDRRFLLTIAGALAREGYAALAIDFPFHGERIACIDASLVGIPNFFPDPLRTLTGFDEDIIRVPPCTSGESATCGDEGQCLRSDGSPDTFWSFPIIDIQSASGAAFLDTSDLPYIPDHFNQALVDLSTLHRAIQVSDWEGAVGLSLDPDNVMYLGQSLGAIIGTVWVSVTPEIRRAVLNVPGSDMVDLFVESTYFGPQIQDYFDNGVMVETPSFEQERLLNVARWLIDAVDPHSIGHLYAEDDRDVMIQMSTGDIIIPNRTTRLLARLSGRPLRTYPSPLHADLIIPALGDAMLTDATDFLAGRITE